MEVCYRAFTHTSHLAGLYSFHRLQNFEMMIKEGRV